MRVILFVVPFFFLLRSHSSNPSPPPPPYLCFIATVLSCCSCYGLLQNFKDSSPNAQHSERLSTDFSNALFVILLLLSTAVDRKNFGKFQRQKIFFLFTLLSLTLSAYYWILVYQHPFMVPRILATICHLDAISTSNDSVAIASVIYVVIFNFMSPISAPLDFDAD